jgi:hypothetical protein
MDRDRYEPERLAYKAGKICEHGMLEYRSNEVHRLRELKYEPKHGDDEVNEYTHPDHHPSQAPSAVHNNHNPHMSTMLYPAPYTSHHAPIDIPHHQSHVPTPPLPPAHMISPMANEPGHVTTLNHMQRVPVFNNSKRKLTPVDNVQPHCKSHTTYLIRTWCNPPLSWSASKHDKACLHHIEESCPLHLQPK